MLELYYTDSCPYCKKVINHFNDCGIEYQARNVNDKNNYEKLLALGKISQVPFLYDTDNNKAMYESDKIIEYAESLKK